MIVESDVRQLVSHIREALANLGSGYRLQQYCGMQYDRNGRTDLQIEKKLPDRSGIWAWLVNPRWKCVAASTRVHGDSTRGFYSLDAGKFGIDWWLYDRSVASELDSVLPECTFIIP